MRNSYDNAIFITDVKLAYHDGPDYAIAHFPEMASFYTKDFDGCAVAVDPVIRQELIKAKPFLTRDGRKVYIGASEEVQKILKIPFDAYEDMSFRIYRQDQELRELYIKDARLARAVAKITDSFPYKFAKTIKQYLELL
jgi:hypothetical protein